MHTSFVVSKWQSCCKSKCQCIHCPELVGYTIRGYLITKQTTHNVAQMCKIRLTHEQSLPRHQAYRLVLLQDIYAGACTTTQIDHAVLLVGFDKMSTGQEYWIIRKQWSAGWGDEGYLYLPISADDDTTGGACGILGKMSGNSPVYPFKAGA